jgi:hypothetical protein
MAKTKKIIEEHKSETVANCDHPKVVVTVRDNQQLAITNRDVKSINIESLIRTIRGQKVMVDFDLAMLYEVQNKRLNEQVKRNKKRFPDDFMFQLTKEEWNILKSQIATAKQSDSQTNGDLKSQIATSSWGGTRKLPYAFTREGIGMLSSVLGSDTAIEMNIRIMRVFTAAHQIMENNAVLFQKVLYLERHQLETDEKINHILTKMEENSPQLLPEQIFQTGCVWDAWTYVSELVRSAKERIELIDNFVDDRVLSLLMKRGKSVPATIHSRFTKDFLTDLEKHNTQYEEVKFVQLPHKNHDRFLIIDDSVYLLGASVKDMGNGLCAVTKLTATPETVLGLLK